MVVSLMTAVWNRAILIQKMRITGEVDSHEKNISLYEMAEKEDELKEKVLARMIEDSPLTK